MLRTSQILLFTSCVFCAGFTGCRNPHAEQDRLQKAFEKSARQYSQDCTANLTSDQARKRCAEERDQVNKRFNEYITFNRRGK